MPADTQFNLWCTFSGLIQIQMDAIKGTNHEMKRAQCKTVGGLCNPLDIEVYQYHLVRKTFR